MTRVAVQIGSAWTRVAAEGRLLAERPTSAGGLSQVLDELFGGPVEELLLVHGAATGPPVAPAPPAWSVRAVSAPVAVLAHYGRSTGIGVEHAVVVDVGHGGTEVALVRRRRARVVRHSAVGGRALDIRTGRALAGKGIRAGPAEVRRVRESLSLLPAVDTGVPSVEVDAGDLYVALAGPLAAVATEVRAAVAAAGPGRSPPVLLVGGVARTPLVAELLDAAGIEDVRVVPRPDAAAVLGALWLVPPASHRPLGGLRPGSTTVGPAPGSGSRPGGPDRAAEPGPAIEAAPDAASAAVGWLPRVTPRRLRRSRLVLGALAAVASVAALLGAGVALPAPPAPSAGDLVQYGYAVRLPAGWAHTGGLPERRRSLLAPLAAPDGSDLISVERTPLGYDAGAEPQRVRTELRRVFSTAVASGRPLSAFDDDAHYAGRAVVSYREADDPTTVDWYVVLDGDAQLSVGCRHTAAGAELVRAACATVVGTVHRTR
jgi:type VII secretion-associated protein (TIGR03931 family)